MKNILSFFFCLVMTSAVSNTCYGQMSVLIKKLGKKMAMNAPTNKIDELSNYKSKPKGSWKRSTNPIRAIDDSFKESITITVSKKGKFINFSAPLDMEKVRVLNRWKNERLRIRTQAYHDSDILLKNGILERLNVDISKINDELLELIRDELSDIIKDEIENNSESQFILEGEEKAGVYIVKQAYNAYQIKSKFDFLKFVMDQFRNGLKETPMPEEGAAK